VEFFAVLVKEWEFSLFLVTRWERERVVCA
jgi:hypothetical protein